MPTYRDCLQEFCRDHLEMGQVFQTVNVVAWFATHYPDKNVGQIRNMVRHSTVNSEIRRKGSIKPSSGLDLFFSIGNKEYRRWDEAGDPPPIYGDIAEHEEDDEEDDEEEEKDAEWSATEFAFERDLRNFLVKNLSAISSDLKLYEEEGITGVEFPVGGRRIDILAQGADGKKFVVIELKVSRGHDKTLGQILRYMAWVGENLAEGKDVQGVIVARNITNDLRLATSLVPSVTLLEYEILFNLKPVEL